MTYEERNNLVAILTNILVMGWLTARLLGMNGEGAFGGPDGLAVWAQTVLWVIPASVGVTIIATILFNILFAIATRDENPSFIIDERDRQIAIRGMVTTMIVASAGFIGALIALAFGWTALLALTVILYGFAAGDLIGSIVKLVLWRRGA